MKSILFFAIISIFITSTGYAQPQNIPISETTIFDGEPYLAVNPTNPENMIIAWMSYVPNPGIPILDQIGIRTKASFDGGKTWENEIMMPHYSQAYHSADVSMAFYKDGTLYIEYIDYRLNPDSGVIVVSHSINGGKSWSTLSKAFDLYDNNDKPIDRPWIAIDNSGSVSDGTIYITTKPVYWDPIPNRPYMKYSTDGGSSWSKIDTIDGGDYLAGLLVQPMVSPVVTSDGVFHAAYASWPKVTAPVKYTLASSNDKGANYTRTTIYIPKAGTNGDTLSKLGYHLAANPNDAKNMIFVWPDSKDGDLDVYSSVTTDGGATWSDALRVNDDSVGDNVLQDLLWANFSDNGKCVISWRDRRNGTGSGYDQSSDIYFAVSTDKGKTFGKNIRLSDQTASFNKILNGAGNDFHSTYIIHDSISATWGDTRTGKLTIYFAKAALRDGIADVVNVSSGSEDTFSVFPNPIKNSATIQTNFPLSEEVQLFIFDENGKQILHQSYKKIGFFEQSIDCSDFPNGAYFLNLKTSKEIFTKKIVVEH